MQRERSVNETYRPLKMSHYFPVYWKTPAGAECSGYMDSAGKLVADFPHIRVSVLNNERAFFADGSRWENGLLLWGVMDNRGHAITPPRLTSFKPFSEGRAVASDEHNTTLSFKFGFLNEAGEWAVMPTLIGAYSFSAGAAYVQREPSSSLWHLIGKQGELLIDKLSLGGSSLKEGLAKAYVSESKLFGFRSMDGAWKIKAQFVGVKDFAEGLAAVLTGKPGKECVHFIDAAGEVVIEPSHYTSCEKGFSEGLACVFRVAKRRNDIVGGYINRVGEEVISCDWGLAEPFSDGLAAVMDAQTRLWGFVNRNGKIVIPPKYGHVESFAGGLAKVRTSKRIGPEFYINPQGDVVWEAGSKPRA